MREALVVVVVVVVAGISCGNHGEEAPDSNPDRKPQGRLHVMIDAQKAVGIETTELHITPCGEAEAIVSETVAVGANRETLVPAHVGGTDHLFVESYRNLESGCYDVEVRLLDGRNSPSDRCSRAVGRKLQVREDETTEAVLYSRCGSRDHRFQVQSLEFDPGYRVGCHERIAVCATIDGAGAEVAVDWRIDGASSDSIEPVEVDETKGKHVECVEWPSSDHGASVGSIEAYPARAETTEGGDTVVKYETHEVAFTAYVECRGDRRPRTVQPPDGDYVETKIRRVGP